MRSNRTIDPDVVLLARIALAITGLTPAWVGGLYLMQAHAVVLYLIWPGVLLAALTTIGGAVLLAIGRMMRRSVRAERLKARRREAERRPALHGGLPLPE